ncbi:tetratricopeptide repeat protein [Flavobacteriaceae bacterium]|nr:tetratricopeptide repeat protein [Flavobacteriaceae bacterium]
MKKLLLISALFICPLIFYSGVIAQNTEKTIDSLFNLGVNKIKSKDYDSAEKLFTKVLELDSLEISSYFNRGIAKEANGDIKGAFLDYYKSAEISFNKAVNSYDNYDFGRAIALFDSSIDKLHISLNIIILRNDDLDQTKITLEDVKFNLSLAYRIRGAAKACFGGVSNCKESKDQESDEDIFGNFYDPKELDIVLRDLDESIKYNPNDCVTQSFRADLLYENGLIDEACQFWRKATELNCLNAEESLKKYCK